MGLDINTEKGQISAEQEREAAALFERHHPGCVYVHTPKTKPADYDAMIVKGGATKFLVAMRCSAKYDLRTFKGRSFNSEMLITFHKLLKGVDSARASWVPFYLMMYFPQDRTLMMCCLWRPEDGYQVVFRVKKTETQETINGGKVWRDNAFVDCSGAAYVSDEAEAVEKAA